MPSFSKNDVLLIRIYYAVEALSTGDLLPAARLPGSRFL
jgi:hypothetical protein